MVILMIGQKLSPPESEVSEYLVRKARKVKSENGILSIPAPKQGKVLPILSKETIQQFYEAPALTELREPFFGVNAMSASPTEY